MSKSSCCNGTEIASYCELDCDLVFPGIDLNWHDTTTPGNNIKAGLSGSIKKKSTFAKKKAFAIFVKGLRTTEHSSQTVHSNMSRWKCCDQDFMNLTDVHKHVAAQHSSDVSQLTGCILEELALSGSTTLPRTGLKDNTGAIENVSWNNCPVSDWLPDANHLSHDDLTSQQMIGYSSYSPALISGRVHPCSYTLKINFLKMESTWGREEGLIFLPHNIVAFRSYSTYSFHLPVLLFYCYCDVKDPQWICNWQMVMGELLHLTGKVRIATEGINGTVGGSMLSTSLYIRTMLSHPIFKDVMYPDDFKTSEGGAHCFPDLRVGVFQEIVPMGIAPHKVSYKETAPHLSPEKFHEKVYKYLSEVDKADHNTILLDCRNFYESKIGRFQNCLAPDIRKFSYFPKYIDQNLELFKDKTVLMYCTGGIRCERGSAYLRSKSICKEVYQLKGGIHKYLEQFPDGFFRGKLFVFDERYTISSNDDVISNCRYCDIAWDEYKLCSTPRCCQLLLACTTCQSKGLTACCTTCQKKNLNIQHDSIQHDFKEECECTGKRPKIPIEKVCVESSA
ncbi:hypothetical protein GDO86_001290 [Hymenochirus boettgeri]|uniref:Thiosulfate sulfurtransferase/rhodanese-like domain-containing protein 2 n=1 Tax=Hymenochirus boettgeri TaxID=247094 RepID=A0A8T2KKU3_9PIPI|nr:hypothetical protein GDO86_001290 [Hymenochirus boettgeri]